MLGDRLIIANGIGCSTVWGGTAYCNPYSVDPKTGRGPAWACSLFEDTAEFGYGIALGTLVRRRALHGKVLELVSGDKQCLSPDLKAALADWANKWQDAGQAAALARQQIVPMLEKERGKATRSAAIDELWESRELLEKASHWIVGGDGWAYDIGYGGLDHVLASGEPVKVLVLDNETYGNTGGQCSKATPPGAVTKLASGGKRSRKKDLGLMAVAQGGAYVASVCYGANAEQTVRAIAEAEAFPGPAVVLCYCPCIEHGIAGGLATGGTLAHMKKAVTSGYWPLYRFDPRRPADSALKFDPPYDSSQAAQEEDRKKVREFTALEGRFAALAKKKDDGPQLAERLAEKLAQSVNQRAALLSAVAQQRANTLIDLSHDT
jgi:pyruvate-ferredoxin/flavodoxin oxidoreductase